MVHKSKQNKNKPNKRKPRPQTNGKATDGAQLNAQLGIIGLRISHVTADGNCLFRAIADQLEGNEEEHLKYRKMVIEYIEKNREDYEPFLEDEVPFDEYCKGMREDGTWAGHMELQAISLVTRNNICIHRLMCPRWHILNFKNPEARCIHLSYHNGEHYNSVRRKNDDGEGPAEAVIIESQKSPTEEKRYGSKRTTEKGILIEDVKTLAEEQSIFKDDDKLQERGLEDRDEDAVQAKLSTSVNGEGIHDGDLVKQQILKTSICTHQAASFDDGERDAANSRPLQRVQKVSRNKACLCGSKKKYKACCGAVVHKSRTVTSSKESLSSKARKENLRSRKFTAKVKSETVPKDLLDMGYLCI